MTNDRDGNVDEGTVWSRRSRSFGAVAEAYDRYRPTYPPELVADVCAQLPGSRIVEIGAGTGIATSQFAAYDVDITCVEPDPQMAAVLRAKFANDSKVRVTIGTLEAWSTARAETHDGLTYDGLISAQAWHWTAPETRWQDAAAALSSGGLVALFWNFDGYADPTVRDLISAAYERYRVEDRAAPTVEDEQHHWAARELEASTDFTAPEMRVYHWNRMQTVVDHVARLNTTSAHLILPPDVRAALTEDLIETLTQHAGSEIELAMRTDLASARRL